MPLWICKFNKNTLTKEFDWIWSKRYNKNPSKINISLKQTITILRFSNFRKFETLCFSFPIWKCGLKVPLPIQLDLRLRLATLLVQKLEKTTSDLWHHRKQKNPLQMGFTAIRNRLRGKSAIKKCWKTERRISISPTLFRFLGQKFAMGNYIPRSCVILTSSFKGSKVVSRSGSTYAEDVLDDQADDVMSIIQTSKYSLIIQQMITDNCHSLKGNKQIPCQPFQQA